MTNYHLWYDLESDGLDLNGATVLEFAWTVTDDDLVQLTPLRRRFSALRVSKLDVACGVLAPHRISRSLHRLLSRNERFAPTPVVPEAGGTDGWSGHVLPVVASMHEKSGLYGDWLDSREGALAMTLFEHDRLIGEDLAEAGFRAGEGHRVHLAGAGVSHFDALLLRNLGSILPKLMHYRATDVSSACGVLGIQAPKDGAALLGMIERISDLVEIDEAIQEMSIDDSVTEFSTLRYDAIEFVDPRTLVEHRAASDVAFSLVFARAMRAALRSY